jgi:ribosome maturation factor RimP
VLTTQQDKIKELVEPLIEDSALFLVDIEIKGAAVPEVWILLDKEDEDIRIDECTDLSRELSLLLEAHELFANKYRLNVSSPGLSRPLSDPRQYKKNVGRQAKVRFRSNAEDSVLKETGRLMAYEEGVLQLQTEAKKVYSIALDDILEIKIIPSFN